MELKFNLYQFVLASGVAYGLLLFFLLFRKGLNHKPLLYLALTLLAFSLLSWRILLGSSGLAEVYPKFHLYSFLPTLSIMPLLYWYINGLAGYKPTGKQLVLHFLPLLFHLSYQMLRYVPELNNESFRHGAIANSAYWLINLTLLAQLILYSSAIFKIIKTYEDSLKMNYSDLGKLSIEWIRRLLLFIILLFAISAVFIIWSKVEGRKIVDYQWLFAILSIFIYWVGTQGLSRGVFYHELSLQNTSEKEISISQEDQQRAEKLKSMILEKQLFLQNQLSVQEVAKETGLNSREVSFLINQVMGKNFYQLINEMRLAEFIRLTDNPSKSHLSLLGLAMEAGFNSKSVFNEFFKKQMGITPKQFIENQKKKS